MMAASPASGKRLHPIAWILGIAAVAFGGMATVTLVAPAVQVVEAMSWVATPCRILQSEVIAQRAPRGRETFSVRVTYSYSTGGLEFQGQRHSFYNVPDFRESYWRSVAARYPGSAQATCHFDPASPARSVLNRGLGLDFLLGYVAAALFAACVFGLVRVVRHPPTFRRRR